jgi:hypothetical protein
MAIAKHRANLSPVWNRQLETRFSHFENCILRRRQRNVFAYSKNHIENRRFNVGRGRFA